MRGLRKGEWQRHKRETMKHRVKRNQRNQRNQFSSKTTSILCLQSSLFIGENNGGGNRLDVMNFVGTVVLRPGSRGVSS